MIFKPGALGPWIPAQADPIGQAGPMDMDGLVITQSSVTVPTVQILQDALVAGHSGGRRLVPRPDSVNIALRNVVF